MGSGPYLTHLAGLSLMLVGLAFSDAVAVEPENQFVIAHAGAEQTVFSWETQRCDDEDIPDSGLRLFRRYDGQIIGIASHTRTRLFKVSNYGKFIRKCDVVHESSHSSDPADYADATWIAATWTDDGRVVHALGHNEYRANQHWFACRYRTYLSCWYNTIVAMRSVDGGKNFSRQDAPPIAAPNFTQDAYQGSPRGFFDPTNIVRLDDAYYTIVFASGGPDQPSGNCLLRTQDVSDPERWTLFDGQDFVVSIRDPYRPETAHEHLCAPLENLDGRVTGLVRHESSGLFVASLAAQAPNADKGWIGFSLSQDPS